MALGLIHCGICGAQVVVTCHQAGLAADQANARAAGHDVRINQKGGREGGGNLFGLTFDADGNLFFSSNGTDLGYHAVQGGYYRKNFGKHGPLHNPYTYGYFEHLPWDKSPAGPRAKPAAR